MCLIMMVFYVKFFLYHFLFPCVSPFPNSPLIPHSLVFSFTLRTALILAPTLNFTLNRSRFPLPPILSLTHSLPAIFSRHWLGHYFGYKAYPIYTWHHCPPQRELLNLISSHACRDRWIYCAGIPETNKATVWEWWIKSEDYANVWLNVPIE